MAAYDSDSSDEESDYAGTNVLLGYPSKEATDDPISHLGGHPTWLDDKTRPSGALAKCRVCNNYLSLLLELNADIPDRFPDHDRRLYIFSCRRKACRRKDGSVRGLRSIRASKMTATTTKPQVKPEVGKSVNLESASSTKSLGTNLGSSLFGGPSIAVNGTASQPQNPFASSSNPFSTSATPNNPFSKPSSSSSAASPPPSSSQENAVPQDNIPNIRVNGNESNDQVTSALSQSFADKVRLTSSSQAPSPSRPILPAELWPAQSLFPPAYPHLHLEAEYESLFPPSSSTSSNDNNNNSLAQHTISDPSLDAEDDDDDDMMEGSSNTSARAGGAKDTSQDFDSAMDTAFQRFADRVAQNPEQVLRYEFGGEVLLYAAHDAVGRMIGGVSSDPSAGERQRGVRVLVGSAGKRGNSIPRCTTCGGERVFEVQLMPHAITVLEEGDGEEEKGIVGLMDGMDWGTIVLAVCARDCVPDGVGVGVVGFVEEWVGVQWEELGA